MINLDATAINLALVAISKDFHATLGQLQWVVNIYMLTNIIFIIFAGKVADIIAKKPVYLFGVIIFLLASIIAGFSPNLSTLIFARAIQGIGFACTLSLGIIIATQTFPSEKRGFILGCYMSVVGLAQAFGPTVGGMLIQCFSWRWIFLINIPLAILAIIFIAKFYRKNLIEHGNKKMPFFSVALLGMGLSLFVFTLNKLGDWGFDSVFFGASLIVSLVILLVFYFKDKKAVNPLIDFSIFHDKEYFGINFIRCIYMINWVTLVFSLSLYLQNIIKMSAVNTGLMLFCMTLVSGSIAPILGKWLDRIGFKTPTLIAILLSLITFLLLMNLQQKLSLPILIIGLVLMGVSAPIMGSATAAIAMKSLSGKNMGVGMGAFYTIAFLGSAIGVAISGSLISLAKTHYPLNEVVGFMHGIKMVMLLNALFAASSLSVYFMMLARENKNPQSMIDS